MYQIISFILYNVGVFVLSRDNGSLNHAQKSLSGGVGFDLVVFVHMVVSDNRKSGNQILGSDRMDLSEKRFI